MKHPLDFIPPTIRKPIFFAFLLWALIMAAIMQVIGSPLKTPAAPMGIVSFELAGTATQAKAITNSWNQAWMIASNMAEQPNSDVVNVPYAYAAFGLGLDYLFMPSYALALAFAVLLAMGRHKGWLASLGVWVGWGSLAAALFDATENFALWKILLGDYAGPWPGLAAVCATIKFALILLGLGYAVLGGILPKSE